MNDELIYLDCETTGLDPNRHSVWEIAYAFDNDDVPASCFVPHSLEKADAKALEVGNYWKRYWSGPTQEHAVAFEDRLKTGLVGRTIVGANPAFDAAMLQARWGIAPWHYRLLDIESYAMPYFGWNKPKGMRSIYDSLTAEGYSLPEPNHTAAGDVRTLRAAHHILRYKYENLLTAVSDA